MTPLDRIDREIIGLLQKDARRSNREIAAKVNLAESTCSGRIRRLEQTGVIAGYHATVSPQALGIGFQAMVAVTLVRHDEKTIAKFWSHSETLKEATGVFHLTGPNDFLVHLVLRDAEHLRLVATKIPTWSEVASIQTSVVFEHRQSQLAPVEPG